MGGGRTTGRTLGLAAAGAVALLGGEVLAAAMRDYLPTEPPLEIGGSFGVPTDPPLVFAVLGDSTAAGVGAGTPALAYPTLLARRLAAAGRCVRLHGFGVSGAKARDVLFDQLPKAEAVEPDLIFVGVGGNDVIRLTPVPRFRSEYGALLDGLGATGATVVVGSIPDMRLHAFLEPLRRVSGWRGRSLAAVIDAEAAARAVPVVPMAELTGPFFKEHRSLAYAGGDGLHPGPAGYASWADAIAPTLIVALDGRADGSGGPG
jgi:lysophospholipase L1-like esterase